MKSKNLYRGLAEVVVVLWLAFFVQAQAAELVKPATKKETKTVNGSESGTKTGSSALPSDAKGSVSGKDRAILAGGCFWGMEEILRKIPGIVETKVGYTGGAVAAPSYEQVCTGRTGHAEAIEILFDPAKLSYEALLGYFFRMHDPTTLNRQHNDVGTQYRSAIFFVSEEQKQTAEKVRAKFDASGRFRRPIVTQIVAASEFFPAENYHQKYLVKHPGGYNCHVLTD